MEIFILSILPEYIESYDRSLSSKIHNELKKYTNIKHIYYSYKDDNKKNDKIIKINVPFLWSNIVTKILDLVYITIKNIYYIYNDKSDIIWIAATPGVSEFMILFYPLIFPNKIFFVQLFTPSVNKSKIKRKIMNYIFGKILLIYDYIGMVGTVCKESFKVPENKIAYVKIGYPEYGIIENKNINDIEMIYLGTITGRDIWKTIYSLKIVTSKYDNINIRYHIIGGGKKEDIKLLLESINKTKLKDKVIYHGYQTIEYVKNIISKCNIGISFVPITEYYNHVPSTKSIEYLLCGMPVIATRTKFNEEIINENNGVLCEDNIEDFALAIERIYQNRYLYNYKNIKEMHEKYGITFNIKEYYLPELVKINKKSKT